MSRDETRETLRAFVLRTGPAKGGGYLAPQHQERYLDEMEALCEALARTSWTALVADPERWPERFRYWVERADDPDELFKHPAHGMYDQYKANALRASREKAAREAAEAADAAAPQDGDEGRPA